MGSMISKPKMPRQTAPVIQKTVAPAPVEPAKKPEPTADELRLQALLKRRRGRLGTVQTSLRGMLSNAGDMLPPRKTLLGE